jgi:hypothetical protein
MHIMHIPSRDITAGVPPLTAIVAKCLEQVAEDYLYGAQIKQYDNMRVAPRNMGQDGS